MQFSVHIPYHTKLKRHIAWVLRDVFALLDVMGYFIDGVSKRLQHRTENSPIRLAAVFPPSTLDLKKLFCLASCGFKVRTSQEAEFCDIVCAVKGFPTRGKVRSSQLYDVCTGLFIYPLGLKQLASVRLPLPMGRCHPARRE